MNGLRLFTALLLGAAALLALPQATAAPSAYPRHACTIVGTPRGEYLAGTSGRDVICGLGGNDMIGGGPGNDILIGGPGNDTLQGDTGRDTLLGGPGNDLFIAWDGQSDVINGGSGRDQAKVDPTLDRVSQVELR